MEHIFMDPWDLELISFQVYVTEKMATQASLLHISTATAWSLSQGLRTA